MLQVLTAEVVACNSCDLLLIVLIHSHATRDVPVTYLGPHVTHCQYDTQQGLYNMYTGLETNVAV